MNKFSLPISRATHSRTAIRAPVLRPAGRKTASAEQASSEPPAPQEHTLMVRVEVLLWAGYPLSSTTTGRTYTSCSRRWKPERRVTMPAVLSGNQQMGINNNTAGSEHTITIWLLAVLKHIHGRDNKKCDIHARNKSTSGKITKLSHHRSPGLIKHSPPSCILESKFLQVEDLTHLSQPHLE
ncbi:hypothetical protein F7725_012000, partial [Dissostichus mawsoni]